MRQKSIKLGVLVLLAALLASLVIPAGAAIPEQPCSLTIEFKNKDTAISGGTFRAYKVAEFSQTDSYPLTDKFKPYLAETENPNAITGMESAEDWNTLAAGLDNYVKNKNPEADSTGKTGTDGKLTFPNVTDPGLYLVMGDKLTVGRTVYTPTTFLVMLPGLKQREDGIHYDYVYAVTSEVKVSVTTKPSGGGGGGGGGTKPTPVNPTPVDPTPVDPTPVDPTPIDPTPVDPTPVDPTPVTPERSVDLVIPNTVIYTGPGNRPDTDFTTELTPVDNAPMPDGLEELVRTVSLSDAHPQETTEFKLNFTEPGLYRYTLHEHIGNKSGVTYDDRVYDIYVQVSEGEDGELTASWWAQVRGSDQKVYTLEHVNTWQETKKSAANNTPTKSKLPQTGTELWMVPRMMAGGCGLVAAGIAVRGRKRNG